ncbi:MAG: AAA family ATPase [Candidatus Bathyarchaeia archaeon]
MVRLLALEAMNFKRLSLQNPLNFSDGITLIAGQNESGKSTILDAILFSLFARTIRPSARPRDEDILQYGTNKLTLKLTFKVEDRTFVVERKIHRKRPNEATLSEILANGTGRTIATKVNSVNDEITKLLGGLTFEEIIASNVVAQKQLDRVVEQSRANRIGVINAFLNLGSFTQGAEELGEERSAIEGTPKTLGTLPVARQKLEELQKQLEGWNAERKELENSGKKITALELSTEEKRGQYKKTHELASKLESYQKELAKKNQIASGIKNKTETFDGIKKQIDGLESKQKQLDALNEAWKKYRGIDDLSSRVDLLSKSADDLQNKRLQLQTKEYSAPISSEVLQKENEEVQNHPGSIGIQQARKMRQDARRVTIVGMLMILAGVALGVMVNWLLFALTAAGIVGLIYAVMLSGKGSALATQHADYLGKVQSYENQKKIYEDYQKELSALRVQVSEAIGRLVGDITAFPRYQEITQTSQEAVQIARSVKARFDQDKTESAVLSSRISELERDLVDRVGLEKQLENLSGQIQELRKQDDAAILPELPEGTTYSDDLLATTKIKDQNLHDVIVENLEAIRNTNETIGKLAKSVEEKKELPNQFEAQQKTVRALERRVRVVHDARMGIEKTSESLRTRVKPSVEHYMSMFLPSVTMNRYKIVSLNEDYNLSVWDAEAGELRAREVFSGGTEDQLLLVMRLAFALALTPEAKGTRPDFLFLDEPLGSSDDIRRDEIVQLLKTELAQYFKQILLISHIQGVEQDVDHIVRLEGGRITEQM